MLFYDLIIIFLAGITGMWKALPVGFMLQTPPVMIALMTCLGALCNVFLIYFLGKKLERLIFKMYSEKNKIKKQNKTRRLFEKYGSPGLGIIGTLIFGQPVVMIMGMLLVNDKKKFVIWVSIGTIIWSIALTALGTYSIEMLNRLSF